MRSAIPCVASLMILFSACSSETPDYPAATKRPVELERHGHVRIDDYFWLNQRDDSEVLQYLEAENDYADSKLDATAGLRARLVE